jgi:hypothetical protein
MDEGGAIFCDGQFVNAENSQTCRDQLKAQFQIDINWDAAGDAIVDTAGDVADTTGDVASDIGDKGEKCGDAACAVSNVGAGRGASGAAAFGLCAIGFGLQRLRRRRAAQHVKD